jgi:IclR family KDG regulon transcriptional repressor
MWRAHEMDISHSEMMASMNVTDLARRDNVSTAVLRALAMLDVVVAEPRGISLTVAASRAVLSKPTTYRLLQALVRGGLVARDVTNGLYRPSLKLVQMGEQVLQAYDFPSIARPHMLKLSAAVGHGVAAGVVQGGEVIYVERIEASTEIRVHHQLGGHLPIHISSVGKAIVAHLPGDELDALLRDYHFERFTDHTIVERDAFLLDLAKGRRQGWALSRNEGVLGGSSISAPVFDHTGRVVGAIGISSVSVVLRGAELQRMVELLGTACRATSTDLGYVDRSQAPTRAAERRIPTRQMVQGGHKDRN